MTAEIRRKRRVNCEVTTEMKSAPLLDVKTWCCACLKYVHKRTKGQPWCMRAGWTRGGTMLVDTMVTCIECRFAEDQEWLDFSKGSA